MELFMVHISHFGINTSWKFSNKNWVTLVITHISKGVSMHHPGLGGIPTPCGALRRPAAPCGLQEIDDLHELFLRLVDARHVLELHALKTMGLLQDGAPPVM